MKRRLIGIFTGSRAEYGLQYPILQAVAAHPALDYQLFVAGSHFDDDFGNTCLEIREDGWDIAAQEAFTLTDDTIAATAQAIGQGVLVSTRVLNRLQPDIFIVYGDRFEAFAALIASTQMGLPSIHIEGGDITQGGTLDDSVRHAMSKLAHMHFVTNLQAAEHLRRMGEEPWRIYNVGFPGNDLVKDQQYASIETIIEKYQLSLDKPILLFTQHPIPTRMEEQEQALASSLTALAELSNDDLQIVITYPNSDAGSRRYVQQLHEFVALYDNIQLQAHLGAYDYRGILAMIAETGGACIGNSSSGLKETPAFCCPAIDIGPRQEGRLRAGNALHVEHDTQAIIAAVRHVLSDEFRAHCRQCKNPYENGNSGEQITQILSSVALGPELLRKRMTFLDP